MTERQQVDISTLSIFRGMALIFGFVLLYLLSDVVVILLFAVVLASAASPFIEWFERRRVPRLVGVLLLYMIVFGLGVVISSLVIPSVSTDLSSLSSYLPKITQQLSNSLDQVQDGAPKYFDFVSEIQNILSALTGYLQQFSQSTFNLVIGVFGGLFSFVAVIVISFYLAVQKKGIETFMQSVIPERHEEYIIHLWKRAEIKVGLWLQGQMLLGLMMGLIVYVGLSLLKVKFALLFAVIAMLLEIIPMAGPVLAAIPAVMMAFLQDPALGLWVFVFYVVAQQLENHILVPLVIGKTIGLNPVVVILAILIGSQLLGIPGALLGVPVATIIVEILDDMARSKSARRPA